MVDLKSELTATLRERGVPDPESALVAAWSGRVSRLDGAGLNLDSAYRPTAVLGVTRQTGHLLTSLGLVSFALADLKSAHSAGPGHLGLDVAPGNGPRIVIDLAMDMPVAVAAQLNEMRSAANRAVQKQSERRPPAKRRVQPDR